MTHKKKIVFFVLFLVAPSCISYFIYFYGITIPFSDQWGLVQLLKNTQAGKLALSDLWAQHNEHRIFFPRLIMLTLASLADWNIMYELYMNLILAGMTLLILWLILQKTFYRVDSTAIKWLPAAFSLLIFSPAQWENFTWGWQIQIFLSVLATSVGVWAVTNWPGKLMGVAIGILAAVVASYSFNNGLLTWVVVEMVLLMQRERKWRFVILWNVVFAASVAFYYYGYTKPDYTPSLLFFLQHPYGFIRYILAYLGSPLGFGEINLSIAIGLFLLFALCFCSYQIRNSDREGFNKILPWLALSVYAILSSVVTGIARLGYGVAQALSSRYTTICTLVIISTLVTATFWIENHLKNHKAQEMRLVVIISGVSTLLLLSYVLSFFTGIERLVGRGTHIQGARAWLENVDVVDEECLKILYPNAGVVREGAKTLSEMGFIRKVQWEKLNRVKGGLMSIDLVNERLYATSKEKIVIDTDKEKSLTVRGWAVDDLKKNSGEKVYLVFIRDSKEIIIPTRREKRQDVAKYFGVSSYMKSGWSIALNTSFFKGRCYSISVRILRKNEEAYFELDVDKPICFI